LIGTFSRKLSTLPGLEALLGESVIHRPPPLRTWVPPPQPRKRRMKKIRTTLRLSPEVLEEFNASGPGWQTRMDDVLLKMVMEKEVSFSEISSATAGT